MGFFRKFLGGTAQAENQAPRRPEPETTSLVELSWQTLQDLVDEINKSGPSGSLVGIPLQQRIKFRDEITVIGERMQTNRAKVKVRPKEYVSKTIGQILGDLATAAAADPYCQLPLESNAPDGPTIAQRCKDFATEVLQKEREVEHERKLEHDRRKL